MEEVRTLQTILVRWGINPSNSSHLFPMRFNQNLNHWGSSRYKSFMPVYALSDFSVLFPSGERALFKCQSYHSFPYWNIRIKCNTSQALFSLFSVKLIKNNYDFSWLVCAKCCKFHPAANWDSLSIRLFGWIGYFVANTCMIAFWNDLTLAGVLISKRSILSK